MLRENSSWKNDPRKKIVQIDPRLSNTAAGADQWVAVKPGTESVLALGFANVILQELLYNPNFINYYSSGFEAWKEKVLTDFHPDKVAQITGVDPETVKSIGREFKCHMAGVYLREFCCNHIPYRVISRAAGPFKSLKIM